MIHIETFKEGKINFVKLPKAEFDTILEELEDLRDLQTAKITKKRINAGLEETFPAEFVYAVGAAKTSGKRIALWRKFRGLKRDDLAKIVGVTGSYISMIENGKRKGDIDLFKKIADSLVCDISDLLQKSPNN